MAAESAGLSTAALDIIKIGGSAAYGRLVVGDAGNVQAREILGGMTPAQLLSGAVVGADDARSILAGLWLWQDWLAEAHAISQGIESATGSFWHAIMHRREGDFSNSQYWYARCATHPIMATLSAHAVTLVNPYPASKMLLRLVAGGWKPDAFVDLVRHVHERADDPLYPAAVALQRLEWRLLLDHCVRGALGQ